MTRARDLADGTFANGVDVNGTIKLDGNYPTGTGNVALGDYALNGSMTGSYNVAVGQSGLTSLTSGSYNSAFGQGTLAVTTSGSSNVAVGTNALLSNTTASYNTAVGYQASYNNTTGQITSFGSQALYANTTGTYNTGIGVNALVSNTTGSYNTSFGWTALNNNTTANSNTAVGQASGYSTTTGAGNTFLGRDSGYYVTTGNNNTILGRYNGNQGGLDIRTSSNYIVLSDGDGNPRGVFDSSGNLSVGAQIGGPGGFAFSGTTLGASGYIVSQRDNLTIVYLNRTGSDGTLVSLNQAGTEEGSISVSGTTVSYNGGHLSRWSQLADNTKDEGILKGTVMTNLDQMAEWTNEGVTEDNEQLNCMAVSSVEGDPNVAGVFVNWDNDDDIYTNDMNVAMTGDMVIRIAQGTAVARGDLLMSAGDGTAKPQGDDIVRSKTIAKVTSINVSHTYDDGSYLVPCVLMAC